MAKVLPRPGESTKAFPKEPLPLRSVIQLPWGDAVEKLMSEDTIEISGIYGIKPPKVQIYSDLEQYYDAVTSLVTHTREQIEELALKQDEPFHVTRENAVKSMVAKHNPKNTGICARVTSPASELDAVAWIDPKVVGEKLKETVFGESIHAVVTKVECLLGHQHPKEIHETLDTIHTLSHYTGARRERFLHHLGDEITRYEQTDGRFGVPATHYVAYSTVSQANFMFNEDNEKLKDVAVILTSTRGICEEGDPAAIPKLTKFFTALAEKEHTEPGFLRGKADEVRKMLSEKDR